MISEQFMESDMKSPGPGMFKIYISSDKKQLYKKIKNPIKNIDLYKKKINEAINNDLICMYIYKPNNIYITNDGSYYCEYIKNGIRLYDININSNIDKIILKHLKECIIDIKKDLNNYCTRIKKLNGDWALHNLVYCIDTKQIYNVDLEGFYTYPHINHNDPCCNINYINDCFNELIHIIDKKII